MTMLPISAIIPTIGRRNRLVQTLRSVLTQDALPSQIVVVDGSMVAWSRAELVGMLDALLPENVNLVVEIAIQRGAAAQRNQAVELSLQPFIWFLDDDVDLEAGCLSALWLAMECNDRLGGCNAIITNQHYSPPGRTMRWLLSWIGCPASGSLAGLCRGPVMYFLPTDDIGNEVRKVEWMNTTCTLYRSAALPHPPFLRYFQGYSLMEDSALSLEVGKRWNLGIVSNARIYHDTIPATYKSRVVARQSMEVANRWFVARRVVGCPPLQLLYWLILLQLIGLMGMLRIPSRWVTIPAWCLGSAIGWLKIARHHSDWEGYSPHM